MPYVGFAVFYRTIIGGETTRCVMPANITSRAKAMDMVFPGLGRKYLQDYVLSNSTVYNTNKPVGWDVVDIKEELNFNPPGQALFHVFPVYDTDVDDPDSTDNIKVVSFIISGQHEGENTVQNEDNYYKETQTTLDLINRGEIIYDAPTDEEMRHQPYLSHNGSVTVWGDDHTTGECVYSDYIGDESVGEDDSDTSDTDDDLYEEGFEEEFEEDEIHHNDNW